jgi:HAD superfamily hydrolase (TIGR01458 family)
VNVKGIVIDLDGVLYQGDSVIPGAVESVRYLKNKGYTIRYLSNTTRKSRKTLKLKLHQLGIEISSDLIITPAVAAIAFISQSDRKKCHLLTTGDVHTEFETAGFRSRDNDVEWVVIGDAGDNFSYERMTRVFRFIKEGAGIIALEKDRYWMGNDGLMLSAGPFVQALEYATGKSATVIGKPSPQFFGIALQSMKMNPAEVVMIGDDVTSDTGGAMRAGLHGILVKTGKFSDDTLRNADLQPDFVIESISSIRDIL